MCSTFTGEYPCRNVISIRLLIKFIEITFWHRFSPANLLYIFRTSFPKNTSGWPLLPLLIFRNIDYKCDEDSITFSLPLKDIHYFFFFFSLFVLFYWAVKTKTYPPGMIPKLPAWEIAIMSPLLKFCAINRVRTNMFTIYFTLTLKT